MACTLLLLGVCITTNGLLSHDSERLLQIREKFHAHSDPESIRGTPGIPEAFPPGAVSRPKRMYFGTGIFAYSCFYYCYY